MAIYMWREYVMPDYLCFTANTGNSTVKLQKNGSPTSVNIETSTDGINWSTYTFGTTITLSNVGDKIYWRNTSETTTGFSKSSSNYYRFILTGSVSSSGDITYLVNKNGTDTLNGDFCFYMLFYNCTSLVTSPTLKATTLTARCYQGLFFGCDNLSTMPVITTTNFPEGCLRQMFNGCSKIKLSATQTGEYQTPYRLPDTGTGTGGGSGNTARNYNMFTSTGGTFTGTPTINTTYYTSNTVI